MMRCHNHLDDLTIQGYQPPLNTQFAVFLDNRVGKLLELIEVFNGHALELVALNLADSADHAVVRLVTLYAELAFRLLTRHNTPFSETEVLVVELMDQILPGMDREMAGQLGRLLKRQGVECRLGASAQVMQVKDGKVKLTVAVGDKESVESCDRVLVALGRRPYSAGLGLADVGVEVNERGQVVVDEHFHSNVEGIWAIGDLIQGPMLAHTAEVEGVAAVEDGKTAIINVVLDA